jgi:hypothetical protein
MGIDSSIALGVKPVQIENPMNALAQMMQLKDAQQASQMNVMKMDEYQRGVTSQNSLRQLMGGFGSDHGANQTKLMQGGYLKESQDYAKNQADVGKVQADSQIKQLEAAHKRIDLMGQAFGFVKDNPTAESAIRATDYMVEMGIMTAEQAAQTKQRIASDPSPQTIQKLATQAYQGALSTKDQLPKLQTVNAGNRQVNQSVNPITGIATETGSTPILQSADSVASNAQSNTNSLRVDARSRDATAATLSKPFEVTGPDGVPVLVQQSKDGKITPVTGYSPKTASDKPMNEGQSKAALFGSRMKASHEVLDSLAGDGVTTSTPGSRTGFGVGAVLNTMSSAKQQQLNQAKRDFVNAVLRRESGAAIAESEFSNADSQYFPQVGDAPEVIQQKSNNRALAIRGILAEVPKSHRGALDEIAGKPATPAGKTVVKTGTLNGRKVHQYSDGTTDYAN